jgi:hypothetical protein
LGENMAKLEDLVVDPDVIDREVLANGLANFVGVTQAGAPYPLERWSELNERGKVIGMVLATRAASTLGRRATPTITPAEVAKGAGVAPGTVRRELRALAETRVVTVDQRGNYSVNGVNLRRALQLMTEGRPRRGR